MSPELELEIHPDAVNAAFWPYLDSRARFLLFWGGRDSSKSDFVALKLLLDCLTLPYFKCVLVRNVFNTIGGSMVATLRKVAEREGIDDLFTWGVSPLGIKCKENGNSFVPHGMDNPGKLKSLSDPTHAWYEEANQIAKADAEVLSSSLRTSEPGTYLQEIYSFNPDHEGDYKTFWLWQKFFEGTGHGSDLSFGGRLAIDVSGQLIEMPFEVLHTTYADNRWCPPERAALYESYAAADPYRHRVWAKGLWATKQTGNEFYPQFSRAKHTAKIDYLPTLPIWQSWDANSLPYCAMFCGQNDDQRTQGGKRTLRIFREYAIGSPNSGLRNTGHAFLKDRRTFGWMDSAVMLTGDASMRARKPSDERSTALGDVLAALNGFTDTDGKPVPGCLNGRSDSFWPKRNPEVERRRDFVNYVLAGGLPEVQVLIDASCTNLIADMELVQLGVDGKLKEMYTDKALGVRYQIRGHFSDICEYWITTILQPEYEAFKAGRGG
ncbi:phage terminase large subunit [Hymenobacter ruber]